MEQRGSDAELGRRNNKEKIKNRTEKEEGRRAGREEAREKGKKGKNKD